jgi:hypothetical protein
MAEVLMHLYGSFSGSCILLAGFAVSKYNSIKVLKFFSGDYCSTVRDEFHISYK